MVHGQAPSSAGVPILEGRAPEAEAAAGKEGPAQRYTSAPKGELLIPTEAAAGAIWTQRVVDRRPTTQTDRSSLWLLALLCFRLLAITVSCSFSNSLRLQFRFRLNLGPPHLLLHLLLRHVRLQLLNRLT